jgi:predicted secreted protein
MFKNAFMTMVVAAVSVAQGWAGSVEQKTAELKVGETQVLELQGNPTTGFRWMLAEALPADSPVSVEIAYESAASRKPLCGRGGVFKVSYTGVKPGETTVVLIYARPWEKDAYPSTKVNLTVKVN